MASNAQTQVLWDAVDITIRGHRSGLGARALVPALDEEVELVLGNGDDLEAHIGVGLAAELRTFTVVDPGRIRLDRHDVGVARNHVHLAGELGHIEGVDHVRGEEFDPDAGIDRNVELVGGHDIGNGFWFLVVNLPPPLFSVDLDDVLALVGAVFDPVHRPHRRDEDRDQDDGRDDCPDDLEFLICVDLRRSGLVFAPPSVLEHGQDDDDLHADEDRQGDPEDQFVEELDVPRVLGFRR